MNIIIGSDHAGYNLKVELIKYLQLSNYKVNDVGTYNEIPVDYPDIVRPVCEVVLENDDVIGILICGTGIGMSIAANRLSGIRAALCFSKEVAEKARQHNDANVLILSGRVISIQQAHEIVDSFLKSTFEGGRHIVRLAKIS